MVVGQFLPVLAGLKGEATLIGGPEDVCFCTEATSTATTPASIKSRWGGRNFPEMTGHTAYPNLNAGICDGRNISRPGPHSRANDVAIQFHWSRRS